MAKKKKRIAVFDCETDPFLYGRIPRPFAWGFMMDDGEYVSFWGDDCTEQFKFFLRSLDDEFICYAHNGGRFDFHYLLDEIDGAAKIINGRIAVCKFDKHTFQDSFCALPVGLAAYQKDKIDYEKFEEENREEHKAEILKYLESDCRYLLEMITAFNTRFGRRLTIGGAAINELAKLHPFEKQREAHDTKFRPFYFGGRVDYFEQGKISGDFKIYDVNSMYPSVMRDSYHPTGAEYVHLYEDARINKNGDIVGYAGMPYFIEFEGWHGGLLPFKDEAVGSLSFSPATGTFRATHHEMKVGLKYKKVRVDKILKVYVCVNKIRFKEFVDFWYNERLACKARGDKIGELLCKLILNSAYGKFGSDPRKYYDFRFCSDEFVGEYVHNEGWEVYEIFDHDKFLIRKPAPSPFGYFDVATAASITGASRAKLAEALFNSTRPLYCDTDSIICEEISGDGVQIDQGVLGAWKCEGEADTLYIGGKKLYAARKGKGDKKLAEKMAKEFGANSKQYWEALGWNKWGSKGAKMTPTEIAEISGGVEIEWKSESPNFSLTRNPLFGEFAGETSKNFISRKIRRTDTKEEKEAKKKKVEKMVESGCIPDFDEL